MVPLLKAGSQSENTPMTSPMADHPAEGQEVIIDYPATPAETKPKKTKKKKKKATAQPSPTPDLAVSQLAEPTPVPVLSPSNPFRPPASPTQVAAVVPTSSTNPFLTEVVASDASSKVTTSSSSANPFLSDQSTTVTVTNTSADSPPHARRPTKMPEGAVLLPMPSPAKPANARDLPVIGKPLTHFDIRTSKLPASGSSPSPKPMPRAQPNQPSHASSSSPANSISSDAPQQTVVVSQCSLALSVFLLGLWISIS